MLIESNDTINLILNDLIILNYIFQLYQLKNTAKLKIFHKYDNFEIIKGLQNDEFIKDVIVAIIWNYIIAD